ncbi:fumarylacetoacetate hydrolase family protein [Paraburkholderia sp. J8-2]|uniref:fumarylacetoacetate hydrolase family protein n=1 Tax=Paraburkholderia sp. J8-2 TaxID=2805440 RepID=UPI002AB775A4|nr:fumarylacetoacetate hydrolase family protein [Paraburkholderia sp. J8-2]
MKLATLKNGERDGQLVVVSRDLSRCAPAGRFAPTMLYAIENWSRVKGALIARYDELNANGIEGARDFHPSGCAAPLPRAPQWLDGSSFLNHGMLMQQAFHLDPIPDAESIPLMYQGASDDFIGPTDDIVVPNDLDGLDFEGEVAVVIDEVPMNVSTEDAGQHIKLLMLVNDVSLRAHGPREMVTGFGFLHAKPSTAFGPVAVTPDELGDAWQNGRVYLPLRVQYNDARVGEPDGREMNFSFGELIAHAAKTRRLHAGTIVGSGTFSNTSRTAGSACIAEVRAIETIEYGAPQTSFMRFGDRVRVEMLDAEGNSVFGAIEQSARAPVPNV